MWALVAAAVACGLASSPLHAQTTLYYGWGNTNISGSQALPTAWPTTGGTWNSTIQNWAVDGTGSSYGAWQSGAVANFGRSTNQVTPAIVLTDNLVVSGLAGGNTNQGVMNLTLTSAVARTLTFSGSDPVVGVTFNRPNSSSVLIGGGLQLVADNPLKQLSVVGTGSVAALGFSGTATHDVDRINLVRDARLSFTGTVGGTNSLVDTAAIVGRGSAAIEFSRAETVGSFDFTNSSANISADTATSGTLNLGALTSTGGVLTMNTLSATSANVTVRATSGVTKADNVSLPWAMYTNTASTRRFLQYNATSDKFTALTTDVLASSDVTTWSGTYGSSTDLYYAWGSGSGNYTGSGPLPSGLTGNLTLKTLAIGPFSSGTVGSNFFFLNLSGNTLTTQAISMGSLGGTPGAAARVANGSITSTNGVLYVYGTGPTAEMGANLSGTMDVILSGGITLNGTSTYTGTMYTVGTVQNTLGGNGVVATGNVVLRPYARLSAAAGRLASTSVVNLEVGSEFTSSGSLTNLVTGSGSVAASGVLTISNAANDYTLGSTILANATLEYANLSALSTGTVTFSGAGGTLRAGVSGTLANAIAMTNPGTLNNNGRAQTLSGVISGSGTVSITGTGVTRLTNAGNSYTGGSTIAGLRTVLEYGSLGALGTGTVTFTGTGNTLRAGTAGTLANGIAMTNSGTISNNGLLQSLSGVISGTGNVSFAGSGTTTLTAFNTYTGTTNLTAGMLLVNGTNSGSGPVNVLAGATLAGNGRIEGLVDVAGNLTPGNVGANGLLTTGSLSLGSTSLTTIQITGTNPALRGVDFDAIDLLAGAPTYGGSLFFDFTFGTPFGSTTTFDIFNFSGSPTNDFFSVTGNGGVYGALSFASSGGGLWTSTTSDPDTTIEFNQATGDVRFVVVPEPGALAICGIGVALAAWRLRRRRA